MNRPGTRQRHFGMTRGNDPAALVGHSRRACVWPPFKRGAPRSGRGSGFLRSPPRLAALGSSFYPKGDFAGGRARRGHGQNPGPPPQGRPARPPVPALSRLIRSGVRTGAPSSPGAGFWLTELFPFSSSLELFGTTGPACGKTAPDIRARRLGIRQPQKGSFHGMLRCPCSEYIPSIPAPVASPDAKISLFAVRSSFAGAIFRSDKIENTGNTCVYFRCFLYSMGGKEPRKTYRLPNLRAHLGLLAYGI